MSTPWASPAPGTPPPRRGPDPRTTVWIIIGVAVVAVLVRRHSISTFQLLFYGSLIPSVILHEVSHGALALAFGDDTAKRAHRLTLNPVHHIDPFGTVILPGLLLLSGHGALAYARPVPVNVSQLRHPRNQSVLVSLVGPAVNIGIAVLCGIAFKTMLSSSLRFQAASGAGPIWMQLLFIAGYANLILAAFNLIPLPPLDGSAVLERFLPQSLLPGYFRIRPFTMFIPLILVVLDPSAFNSFFNWVANHWAHAVV